MACTQDAIALLTSEVTMRNGTAVAALVTKMCAYTDSDDSNREVLAPYLGRVVDILQQHVTSVTVIKSGMTLLRFACRNDSCRAALNTSIDDVMSLLQRHADNCEVIKRVAILLLFVIILALFCYFTYLYYNYLYLFVIFSLVYCLL